MALSQNKPCRRDKCPNLTHNLYCDDHIRPEDTKANLAHGSSSKRGYTYEWQKLRLEVLKEHNYLCAFCLATGRPTPATDVDHIEPIRVNPSKRLDKSNLQVLCRSCHNKKTSLDAIKYPAG